MNYARVHSAHMQRVRIVPPQNVFGGLTSHEDYGEMGGLNAR